MDNLNVTVVQTALHWEDTTANLKQFDQKLNGLNGKTDLIILPEMFTTGFSMQPEKLAETMEGSALQWLREKAAQLNAAITGSLIIKEQQQFYNRLIWMEPSGKLHTYDKRHLFTLAKEQDHYTAGSKRLVVEWKGWRIMPLICYDLRFPVWSRNNLDYDLLIYVANFPHRRRKAWRSLLLARAIENQAYTIGVNRVGEDGNNMYHSGDSAIIDYAGEYYQELAHIEAVCTTTLSYSKQKTFRSKLQFLPDQDSFSIH